MNRPTFNRNPARSAFRKAVRSGIQLAALLLLLLPLIVSPLGVAHGSGGDRPQTMGSATKGEPYFGYGVTAQLLGQPVAPLLNGVIGMQFNWVRQASSWAEIEPSPGRYEWDALDLVVNEIQARGLRLLLVISGTPDWARPAGSNLAHDGPPADLAAFENFVATLAGRYVGAVDAYQVWQAPNVIANWDSPAGLSAGNYVQLIQVAYRAIKAGSPEALVVSANLEPVGESEADGVTSQADLAYLSATYGAGLASSYDVAGLSLHGPAGLGHYQELRQVMAEHGEGGRAVWLTQVTWPCSAKEEEEQEEKQAEFLVETFQMAERSLTIQVMIVDNFNLSIVEPSAPESCTSLICSDWSARPAFLQLAQMRQQQIFSRASGASGDGPHPRNRAPQSGVKPYLYQPGALNQ